MFQDAVTITRRLGYRYLWIDSLCIIQDSYEDWKNESKNMGHIYKASSLTIAAEDAPNSFTGIFESSNEGREISLGNLVNVPCQVNRTGETLQGHVFCGQPRELPPRRSGPLSCRAWTLQEIILSPRLLRFAKEEVWFQCLTSYQKERTSTHGPSDRELRVGDQALRSISKTIVNGPVYGPRGALQHWYDMISDFASRSLTFDSDKFPAISAVAKEFQRQATLNYKAGIWLEDMNFGLAWSSFGPGVTKTTTYVAPSWSWASLNFDRTSRQQRHHVLYPKYSYSPRHRKQPAQIINVIIRNVDMDAFGQVTEGSLEIEAPCLDICCCTVYPSFFDCRQDNEDDHGAWKKGISTYPVTTEESWIPTALESAFLLEYECTEAAEDLHEQLVYLHILSIDFTHGYRGAAFALILQPSGHENLVTFQRVGLAAFSYSPHAVVGGLWPKRKVTII